MSSARNHKKRAHRSEKQHMESTRQMMQFSARADATFPLGIGAFSIFSRNRLGRRRTREKQTAQ